MNSKVITFIHKCLILDRHYSDKSDSLLTVKKLAKYRFLFFVSKTQVFLKRKSNLIQHKIIGLTLLRVEFDLKFQN